MEEYSPQSPPMKSMYNLPFAIYPRTRSLSSKSDLIDTKNTGRFTINEIRNDIFKYKMNAASIKAKIHYLRNQKQSNQKLKTWVKGKIKLINTTRARVLQDQQSKQQLKSEKSKQLEYLKQKATNRRNILKIKRNNSMHIKSLQKLQIGKQMRQSKKLAKQYIEKKEELQFLKRKEQTIKVKKSQLNISRHLQQRQRSKILQGIITHRNKFNQTLQQKNKQIKILNHLKSRQKSQCSDLYQSQNTVVKRFDSLKSTLNSTYKFGRNSNSFHQKLLEDILKKQRKFNKTRQFFKEIQ